MRHGPGEVEPKASAPPLVVRVIGGGLAGPEAALTAARHGCQVDLYEMRAMVDGQPRLTPAHQTIPHRTLVAETRDAPRGLRSFAHCG
jgi:folate-dependent tRNA-U54 methylase TrmFO/GidA